MATQLQIRRGTSTQVAAFTGAEGEIVVNTTNDSVHVNDGSTAGGFELARADFNNISASATLTIGTLNTTNLDLTNLEVTNIKAKDGTAAGSIADSTGVVTLISSSLTTADITTLKIGGSTVTSTAAELNILDGVTSTAAELNILDGVTATTAELNYVDGVTSAIQTQIDAKAPIANPTFTGSVTTDVSEGSANSLNTQISMKHQSGSTGYHLKTIRSASSDEPDGLAFVENTSERMRIRGGNVGIGTSTTTGNSGHSNIFLGGTANIYADSAATADASLSISQNAFVDSDGSWEYRVTDEATNYYQNAGNHVWRNAASGTAGTDISWQEAMRISSGGDLILAANATGAALIKGVSGDQTDRNTGGYPQYTFVGNEGTGIRRASANVLAFDTAGAEAARIDSSGRLGLGTSGPEKLLTLEDAHPTIAFNHTTSWPAANQELGIIEFRTDWNGVGAKIQGVSDAQWGNTDYPGRLTFHTTSDGSASPVERMRIDSSGNLLVGTTDAVNTASNLHDGVTIYSDGRTDISKSGGQPLNLRRRGSDGILVAFFKEASGSITNVGAIGSEGGDSLYVEANNSGLRYSSANRVIPCGTNGASRDNIIDLGSAGSRFDDIYATNGTIQTSDRNEKQDIEALSDAEQRVAEAAKGLLRKFRWKSAVEEKGDDARIHFGIIAQDLQDAFTAEGLDAGRYAMFISSTWTDEETGEERTRMGVRYSELLAFIISAI